VGWPQDRFNGLSRYARQYGGPGATVELFSSGTLSNPDELILALLDLEKDELRALYRERLTREAIAALLAIRERVQKGKLTNKLAADAETESIREMANWLVDCAGRPHDKIIYEKELQLLLHLADEKARKLFLHPSFEQALAKSKATAWVCSDDKTALAALEFLKARNKKVPEEISVIGFDNWQDALEAQLSTYDFNMAGMVQQATQLIINEKSRKAIPLYSEVDGFVVERRTTRR
jgi:hypothetical protein